MKFSIEFIKIKDRKRPLNLEKVKELAESIRQIGLINPISVHEDNTLVCGLHRLEAVKSLGWRQIEVNFTEEKNPLIVELMEIDENIIRYESEYIERGECLKRRKEIYEELYPETKRGGLPGKAGGGKKAKTEMISSFAEDTSEKIGVTPRTVRQEIQIVTLLDPEVKETAKEIGLPKTEALKLMKEIPEEQKAIVAEIKSGNAKNVKQAKKKREKKKKESIKNEMEEEKPDIKIKKPKEIKQGEWWKLGQHLLFCGDTSKPEFIEKIPPSIMVFADPPYGTTNEEWDSAFYWNHDYLQEKAKYVFVTPGISNIFDFAKITKMNYRWSLCGYIKNGMTRGILGFANWIYIALFSNEKKLNRQMQDVEEITIKNNGGSGHKGQKPIDLLLWLIDKFSIEGDFIIDPFLGSGTTLFVAEKLKRICIGGDISEEFCRNIIIKWEQLTGEEACIIEDAV